MSKKCFKCGGEKELSEFYPHPQMADGHLNKCKECTKLDVTARYLSQEGRAKVVAYEKARFQSEHRKAQLREYNKKRRIQNPQKCKALSAVSNAIRDGRITRMPCEVCGEANSQAHHLDYSKPLAVRWMCFKHHREIAHKQKVGI